jgi:pimeloyl-ACP methyl ester carboxylesterase
MHEEFNLQHLKTNGITLRAAVEGDGPLVILVHGWPELWYSWRHQIKPLAEAGYRVVAPDVRGYGGSDKPHAVEAYDMASIMADITGLIDAFGEDTATLVGHDWGAPIVWSTASLHEDRVNAVAGLSVPYRKRAPVSQIEIWKKLFAGKFFYQLYFQEEGVAEAEFEADVATALRKVYYSASGDAAGAFASTDRPADGNMLDPLIDPDPFPAWMTAHDLAYFAENFEAGGFRGPLNRYRNQTRDFNDLPKMGANPIRQPSCFIAGSNDVVRKFVAGVDPYESVGDMLPGLRFSKIIEGPGHWVQQEAPKEVTSALLEFLGSLN